MKRWFRQQTIPGICGRKVEPLFWCWIIENITLPEAQAGWIPSDPDSKICRNCSDRYNSRTHPFRVHKIYHHPMSTRSELVDRISKGKAFEYSESFQHRSIFYVCEILPTTISILLLSTGVSLEPYSQVKHPYYGAV